MAGRHSVPSILFVGQSKPDVAKLITAVTGIDCSADAVPSKNPWAVDCKYYTASINIKCGSFQTIPAAKDLVEALVVLFDPKNESSLGALFAYADQLKSKKPDVCLAVCENFDDAKETYENVNQFCSESAFELIELSPGASLVAGSDSANEESVRYENAEEYGTTRVLNALLANPWSGMKRKKWSPAAPKGEDAENASEADGDKPESAKAEHSETEALANSCAEQMSSVFKGEPTGASGDSGMDDLLTKLKQLKAKSKALSDDERKKYAERVAKSFADATGLDQ